MDRRARAVTFGASALVAAALGSSCGDPLFIVGDLPGLMRVVAGVPESPGSTLDSLATSTGLRGPAGLAVSDGGTLYLSDRLNRRILAVTSDGAVRVVLDHSGGGGGLIQDPVGLAVAADGTLRVTDVGGHRVWTVMPGDGTATPIAGTGDSGSSPDGTAAAEAVLDRPFGIALDPDRGSVIFSERGGHRVRVINDDGTLGTIAGTGTASFAGDGGPATTAALDGPAGLAIADGFLYVADSFNDRVRRIELSTNTIITMAGNGVRGFAGDGGPATAAALSEPLFVAITADGRTLYISDARNDRVRAVGLGSGTILTFAGTGDLAFTGDLRVAGATALSAPGGLAATAFGLLFIADTGHHIVWRVSVRY